MMTWVPYYSAPLSFPKGPSLGHQDRSLAGIAFIVVILHVLLIGFLSNFSHSLPEKQIPSKLIVKTVTLQPRLQPIAPSAVASSSQSSLLSEKELPKEIKTENPSSTPPVTPLKTEQTKAPSLHPSEKIEEKKIHTKTSSPPKKGSVSKIGPKQIQPAASQKPIAPAPVKDAPIKSGKPKTVEKKEPSPQDIAAREAEKKRQQEILALQEQARQQQEALFAKTKENIAKIGETRDKIGSKKSIEMKNGGDSKLPQQIGHLHIDALPTGSVIEGISGKERSYREEIGQRLKRALRLPDLGQVKIKLTLSRSGKVLQVQILSSESEKNKQYIERTIPSLVFPSFGTNFIELSQYTFDIILTHDY
jgi:colicin import membrane protein